MLVSVSALQIPEILHLESGSFLLLKFVLH